MDSKVLKKQAAEHKAWKSAKAKENEAFQSYPLSTKISITERIIEKYPEDHSERIKYQEVLRGYKKRVANS